MAARLMVRLSVKRPLTPGPSPAEGRGENEDTAREVRARPEAHALTKRWKRFRMRDGESLTPNEGSLRFDAL